MNAIAASAAAPIDYQNLRYDYRHHPDQDAATPARHPVVVVGAGPVGLALAIDLAQRQVPVVLLDNDNKLSTGSRAICFAKRSLEIFDRLGCGERMAAKGVSWKLGRVFLQDAQIYEFDLLPEEGHQRPAFVNLQQYYVEGYLAERAAELPLLDIRWNHKVVGVEQHEDHALLTVETPDGSYRLQADWLAACDGSRSTVRQLIGQESKGRIFKDRFLIADVKMKVDFPAERWFWFDPHFHRHQSVLLHMQPDNVWRIDFQLGWEADPEAEKKPENIIPRVKALLAASPFRDAEFELEWASVYTFACLRMEAFRHGRVLFAGDSAHGVSPFGARGANSGVQDADNLAWKLAAVLRGEAPQALLDSYAREREYAADENIRNSTRATDFITPKSELSRLFRDAVLQLASRHPSPVRWSTAGGCRCRPRCMARRSTRRIAGTSKGAWCPARWRPMHPSLRAAASATGCCARLAPTAALPRWCLATAPPPRPACAHLPRPKHRSASYAFRSTTPMPWPRSATTPGPAPPTCCGPTSTCARWRSPTAAAIRAAHARALGKT